MAFCADLRRRWRASGRDLASIAREVRISRAQLYAIVNGEIKRPPSFDAVVGPLIAACNGTEAEVAQWRRRHEVLVDVHAELHRRPTAAPPARPPAPAQLPADVDGFTGRADALDALDSTTARVVTITGTAGVGKTALAVYWAHRAAGDFPDGQLYVDLRGYGRDAAVDPADAVRGFLEALGVQPDRVPPGQDAQAALYRSLTAGRRMLVVLDNARETEQVRPLLASGPGVRTVVTSRDRLAALVADVGAQPVTLDLPDEAEAVALLYRRLGTEPGAPPSTGTRDAVAVAAECGRLPLALALVAARVRLTGFSLAAAAVELRRSGTGTLDGVRGAFSWSYRALSPPAARLFRLLGLTPDADIASAAVATLAGIPLPDGHRALRELTDASLLTEPSPDRYQMHDLLRGYARELAYADETDDDRRGALTRLLDHYTYTAYQADLVLNPTRPPIPMPIEGPASTAGPTGPLRVKTAIEWLATERDALLAALRWARDEGLDRHAWQLGWALDTFLNRQHRWQDEGAAWAVALSAATAMVDRPAEAHAHRFLAIVAGRLDRFEEAHTHMRQAVDVCRAVGDRAGEAETYFFLSYICWLQGDRDRALDHAERALVLWEEVGHPAWEGKASNSVGWYYSQLGDYEKAVRHYERALALHQEAGDPANEALVRNNLGQANAEMGHRDAAVEHYEHGLRLARALGDSVVEAELLVHIGDVYQAMGDVSAAREHWRNALRLLTDAGHPQAADLGHKLAGTAPGSS